MEPGIDDLFRWFVSMEVGGKTVWMRTLGAKDDAARTRAAISAARIVRSRMRADSPERRALIDAMAGNSRQDNLSVLGVWHQQLSRVISMSEPKQSLHPPDPVDPEEPTLEATIVAEEENEEATAKAKENRAAWVDDQVRVLVTQYDGKSDEELFQLALDKEIEAHVNHAYYEAWEYETLARASFLDDEFTQPMFKTAADAGEIGHYVKERMIARYLELDKFARDAEVLKN